MKEMNIFAKDSVQIFSINYISIQMSHIKKLNLNCWYFYSVQFCSSWNIFIFLLCHIFSSLLILILYNSMLLFHWSVYVVTMATTLLFSQFITVTMLCWSNFADVCCLIFPSFWNDCDILKTKIIINCYCQALMFSGLLKVSLSEALRWSSVCLSVRSLSVD